MGVASGGKMLYHVTVKTLAEFLIVLRRRRRDPAGNDPPSVFLDANWLARKFSQRKGGANACISFIALALAVRGVAVVVCGDGDIRHHSKKATTKRIWEAEQAKLNCLLLRKKLSCLVEESRDARITQEQKEQVASEIQKLQSTVKTQENKFSENILPDDFAASLSDALDESKEKIPHQSTGSIIFQKARTQADCVIAFNAVRRTCVAAFANDADFVTMAGKEMLLVKDFKLGKKTEDDKSLFDFLLATGFGDVMKDSITGPLSISQSAVQKPTYPLVERFPDDPLLRALVAVGTGCDTLPKGVPGCGPAKILKSLEAAKSDGVVTDEECLLQLYEKESGLDRSLLLAFANAMLYEPANLASDSVNDEPKFIHQIPASLPVYLEEFAQGSTTPIHIDPTVGKVECCGPCRVPHWFATGEDFKTCAGCQKNVCWLCQASLKYVENEEQYTGTYCIPCLGEAVLGGSPATVLPRVEEMRAALLKENVHDVADLDITEVEELYDALITGKHNDIDLAAVKFPKQPSAFMDNPGGQSFEKEIIFDLLDGASFLRAEELSESDVCGVLRILSELVTFSSVKDMEKKLHERALPDLLIKFAEGSRVDGGERLMKRAAMHALDPRSPSIIGASGSVCLEKDGGATLLKIDAFVRASMKDAVYQNVICFSATDLVACSCTCKSGSEGGEKVVCVHTLATMLKFVHLLLDGLADHAMFELAARWPQQDPDFSADTTATLRKDVMRLMSLVDPTKYSGVITDEQSLTSVLKDFAVGTERGKPPPRPPDHNEKFMPLRDYKVLNPSHKALKKVMEKIEGKTAPVAPAETPTGPEDVSDDVDDGGISNRPSYERINAAITDIYRLLMGHKNGKLVFDQKAMENLKTAVGHRLLTMRAMAAPTNCLSLDDLNKIQCAVTNAMAESETATRIHTNSTTTRKRKISFDDDSESPNTKKQSMSSTEREAVRNNLELKFAAFFPDQVADEFPENEFPENYPDDPDEVDDEQNPAETTLVEAKAINNGAPKKPKAKHYCSFPSCKCNNLSCNGTWHRLPKRPKNVEHGSSWTKYVTHAKKLYAHYESMRRIGRNNFAAIAEKEFRVCTCHEQVETKCETKVVTAYKTDGSVARQERVSVSVTVILAGGVEKQAKTASRGVGNARQKLVIVESVVKAASAQVPELVVEEATELEKLKAELAATKRDLAHANLELQRGHELQSPNAEKATTEMSTLIASGLAVHDKGINKLQKKKTKLFKHSVSTNKKEYQARKKEATVTPFNLAPYQVRARTGFKDVGCLLAFVLVLCDGDIDRMTKRVSNMTWYEEWFLGFEMLFGKTTPTEQTACASFFLRDRSIPVRVFEKTIRTILKTRGRWPTYATKAEDDALRDSKWGAKYGSDVRPVFWDNTGVNLHKFTDALLQRLTYSSYYAGNVAKGGIFVQLCGWLGTWEFYPGAMSDSKYMNETGILELQKIFADNDGGLPFTNILDRGYRSTRAAWRQGQFVLQPTFAKSDKKFSTRDVLRAASVAADRSGNERAVRVSKMSAYVKRGTQQHKNIVRLCDAWLAWSFQANFMFEPIL
jgi:hypothetical protein